MDTTNDIDGEEKPLLRRRRPKSPKDLNEDVDDNNYRRPSKLDLDNQNIKKKFSNISFQEELKVIIDNEQEIDSRDLNLYADTRPNEGLLKSENSSFFGPIISELTRGYSLQNDQDRYIEKRRKVHAFINVPIELEKFLFYGFLQCLDAFCYVFTFLPIRCILSVLGLIFKTNKWSHANICDIIKVSIIIITCLLMQFVDTSRVYHIVRGQGIIKLYFFYNMLEVADKLFSSFGQDILDALMWTAVVKRKRRIISFIVLWICAILYAGLHAFLVLLQATTLNVAVNSKSQSLLTILISTNFVELKGSVFKKFAKPNLFQMSCSDVRERFHLMILLIFVILRNMTANHWRLDHLIELLPDLLIVIAAESLIDAVKHAFITKFNDINFEVYKDFTITLAFDVAKSREESAASDFTDQVSRRMGFIPIPISIMLIRTIIQSIDFTSNLATTFIVVTWIFMLTIKIINGIFLLNKSADHIEEYRNIQKNIEFQLYRKRMAESKSKSAPNSPKMSLIDFNDVLTQSSKGAGFTVSDFLPHIEELRKNNDDYVETAKLKDLSPTPRRSVSMMDFSSVNESIEKTYPPTIQENEEETVPEQKERAQQSPKRKIPPQPMTPARECESLEQIQAFKMPDAGETVQEIRS